MTAPWRFGLVAAALMSAAGLVYAVTRPPPAVDFNDDLIGPVAPGLDIPFDAYALTPGGLLRTDSASGRRNGSDRPMVRTVSSDYLSRDFVFEVDVTIPPETDDIVFVGVGRAERGANFHNEPTGSFLFRIHQLPQFDEIRAAVSVPKLTPEGEPLAFQETVGHSVAGRRLTVRIEHVGDTLTLSIPDQPGSSRTLGIEKYRPLFGGREAYLFFGNTAEGTAFSRVSVRPVAR